MSRGVNGVTSGRTLTRRRVGSMIAGIDGVITVFTELYYILAVLLMFFLFVGFTIMLVGMSRQTNRTDTLMKAALSLPLLAVLFFLFGWWIYWALPTGPGITGGIQWDMAWPNTPGSKSMAPNLADTVSGVFWASFLMMACTTALIFAGAVLERLKSGAFWILIGLLGSIFWVIGAAWGWHYTSWMVDRFGYHDAYGSGVIHSIAGGFALGVLVILGPRVGKFGHDGRVNTIPPTKPFFLMIGFLLTYIGFWGLYLAGNVPLVNPGGVNSEITGDLLTTMTIYLTPTTLSAVSVNFIMSLAGGMLAGFFVSRGQPDWTLAGGIGGLAAASAGNDLYHPLQALLVGGVGTLLAYHAHQMLERRLGLDDAMRVVAIHGASGAFGLIACGFMLWGHPSSPYEDFDAINPLGQLAGMVIVLAVLGFLPGYCTAWILRRFDLLRIPVEVELLGLDIDRRKDAEHAAQALRNTLEEFINEDQR